MIEYDTKFEYDLDVSYELNFDKWLRWTNREKRIYKEKEYSNEEGKKIFKSLYGGVWYSVEMQIERLSSYEQSFKKEI